MVLQFLKDHWQSIAIVILYGLTALVAVKALMETRSTSKALAYLLLLFFIPGLGVLIYLLIGVNRRVNRIYSRKWLSNVRLNERLKEYLRRENRETLLEHSDLVRNKTGIARLLFRDTLAPITSDNEVKLLINGEEKFPALMEALRAAQHHIHLEYYIFEEDIIGREVMDILMEKAKAGVEVRFIYDDFGSSDINRRFLRKMRAAGVEVYPFYKIRLLANRLNYRNHRKIVVIDGHTGFIGGINIADRYINEPRFREAHPAWPFWRDTHLRIHGQGVHTLQFLFMGDWNFCADTDLPITQDFFPDIDVKGEDLVQIAASGPDSERSSIMLSFLAAINRAERSVYITTPYFIPNDAIFNALQQAALSGVDVRLLVPGESDSRMVNSAAASYYEPLLACGVRIFRYNKGFVHAKTMVVDDNLSVVGTANMDIRSFDFNFEVNAFVYSTGVNWQLSEAFLQDCLYAEELNLQDWRDRGRWARFTEAVVRLVSPLL
ncbi:cardiolipin synthase [Chitinophaga lutea]